MVLQCPASMAGVHLQMLVAIPIGLQWMLTVLWLGELWMFIWVRMLHLVADGVGLAAKSSVVIQ